MALDLSAVGAKTAVYDYPYDWKILATYALGIGAKKDELPYVYEAKGPKVYPTFAVVPSFAPMGEMVGKTQGSLASILHGGQSVRIHKKIPSEGVAKTVATLDGIYDMKKMAQAIVKTKTEINGELVFETESSIIFRGEGGWGGAPPPKQEIPEIPDGMQPTWTHEEKTSPEQALLYRISGDQNPLHADPDFAKMVGFPAPILHGLCSYGFVARAVILEALGGDGDRVKFYSAQFRKPVWPGETIRTEGYDLGNGVTAVKAYAADRPDPVIARAWVEASA